MVSKLTTLFSSLLLLQTGSAFADVSTRCYNYDEGLKTLAQPLALLENDSKGSGDKDNLKWASVRGKVDGVFEKLVESLKDPFTLKDKSRAEVKEIALSHPKLTLLKRIETTIHPFVFVSVSWAEEWAYLHNPRVQPESFLLTYQKVDGTSHITKLCGSVELKKLSPTQVDVSLYEEIIATGRNHADVLKNLEGTIQTLRRIAKATTSESSSSTENSKK